MGIFDVFTGAPARRAAQQQRGYLDQTQRTGNAAIDQGQTDAQGFIRTGADTARGDIAGGFGSATGAVGTGADNALAYLGQGTSGAVGAVGGGANNALSILNNGTSGAVGAVGAGADNALGYLDAGEVGARGILGRARSDLLSSGAGYTDLANLGRRYGGATSLGLDSLGVNGAAGNSRAVDAFHAGPGYNFAVDQGLDAINRRRAAGGMLASGNADRDAQTFGQGLANQEYGNWQNRLNSFVNPELSATSGAAAGTAGIGRSLADLGVTEAGTVTGAGVARAGVATNAGNTAAGYINQGGVTGANIASNAGNTMGGILERGGVARAGVATGEGTSLADLLSREGTTLGNTATGEGTTLANLAQGGVGQRLNLTNAVMQPYNNTYGQEAAATTQGSANLWNLGLNAAKLAAGMPPGVGGGFNFGGPTMAPSPNGPNTFSPMYG